MQNTYPYNNILPTISDDSFIAPNASIIGDVHIGSESGIWFGVVIRGDVAKIRIGKRTNIQDGTVIHVTRGGYNTTIGDGVTVGHGAVLHACCLENSCFVGMSATIMDNVVVQTGAMVAAGALVTPNKIIKKGEIWAGNPAKFFRHLTEKESNFIKISENNYVKHVYEYIENLKS